MLSVSFLVVELGGVDADDDQLVGVLLLQLGQVGQGVDAVDAAERPEIEQDDLAAQVLELDRTGGVEPGHAAFQFRARLRRGESAFPLSWRGANPPVSPATSSLSAPGPKPPRAHTRLRTIRTGTAASATHSQVRFGTRGTSGRSDARDISSLLRRAKGQEQPARGAATILNGRVGRRIEAVCNLGARPQTMN